MYHKGKYIGPSEDIVQQHIMEWTDLCSNTYPELSLLFHVPNGGWRGNAEAGRLKAQGVKAGIPDLFLPVARGKYHGLFIELKVGKNKASANQTWWLKKLNEQGYRAVVCNGFDNATRCLKQYLKLKPVERSTQ